MLYGVLEDYTYQPRFEVDPTGSLCYTAILAALANRDVSKLTPQGRYVIG